MCEMLERKTQMKTSENESTQRISRGGFESRGARARRLKIGSLAGAKKTLTICPYCSVGCGIIVHSVENRIVNVEGDPVNPVNEGALCAKGAATHQLVHNPERVLKPKYRAPKSTEWKEVEWDWALDEIARRVKTTRDRTFHLTTESEILETGPGGSGMGAGKEYVVNMTDGMVSIGSCSINNEECYLLQRLMRSWGIVYFDDKTRT